MFLHLSVCPQGGMHGGGACMAGGMHGRGHVWKGGMRGKGVCMVGGMCGRGAYMAGGVCGRRGKHGGGGGGMHGMHAPQQIPRDTVNERAVRILLECILDFCLWLKGKGQKKQKTPELVQAPS